MTDRALIVVFLSMSIGWMIPDFIERVFTHHEVGIEVFLDLDKGSEIPSGNLFDEEELPRLI